MAAANIERFYITFTLLFLHYLKQQTINCSHLFINLVIVIMGHFLHRRLLSRILDQESITLSFHNINIACTCSLLPAVAFLLSLSPLKNMK
jgi:hypothetical protein